MATDTHTDARAESAESMEFPDRDEIAKRAKVVELAEVFILPADDNNPARAIKASALNAVPINGSAKTYIERMLEMYPTAPTVAKSTAVKSVIKLTRSEFTKRGHNLDTQDAPPNSTGAAFGFAMRYFQAAIKWAESSC